MQVADFLLEGGLASLRSVYRLSDLLRREGYSDAAATWHEIAEVMAEIRDNLEEPAVTNNPLGTELLRERTRRPEADRERRQ